MKGIDTMNAKEARENAMKILYPPIEEEIQEILEKIKVHSEKGRTIYHGLLSFEQMNDKAYRKSFKDFF